VKGALRALALLLATAALVACPPDGPPADPVPCSGGFLGDASMPIDFDLTAVSADYETLELKDGDQVSLMRPLQGGEVLFIGARVTNVDACGLQITGALRDEKTQQVRFDTRTINLIPTGDGWGVTGTIGANVAGLISNFSNVPVCPNEWSTTDVDGHAYGLEVTITDRGGRTLLKKIHVTPVCGQPDFASDCRCICRAGYVLGGDCPAEAEDAGAGEGGAADGDAAEDNAADGGNG
jgi:hypothetical protein